MRTIATMAVAAIAFAAAPAQAQMFEAITIANSTGYTINQIFISPVETSEWEEDVLDVNVLEDGEEYEISFRRAENTCNWDLKVVYDDGEEVYWRGLNLCRNWYFELFYNNRTGVTSMQAE